MKFSHQFIILAICLLTACQANNSQKTASEESAKKDFSDSKAIRFATFNTALERAESGQLIAELEAGKSEQAKKIAEIIQRVMPDIIAIQEFDFDKEGRALDLFRKNYLEVSQNGALPIKYPFGVAIPSNTGIPAQLDLDGDGKTNTPNDAFGFGQHEGHYAFAILSKYPLDQGAIRTFKNFLWKDMPNANLPYFPETQKPYYTEQVLDIFRLSSKNHVDVTARIDGKNLHLLVAHPTPPVFDGMEDRNGKRNYDEIRLFADYISQAEKSAYLYDDNGNKGGLSEEASFIIFGDMNADPLDGDSYNTAISQLLQHPRINQKVATGQLIPASNGGSANSQQSEKLKSHKGKPSEDTSEWGLRVDYVLPSNNLQTINSGIFWPAENESFGYLTAKKASSDHRLVWVDVLLD